MRNGAFPLSFLQARREAIIKEFNGGRGLSQRLAELGLTCGTKVKVVRNDMVGPMIISVKESKLLIGRGIALKILVEELERGENLAQMLGQTNLGGEAIDEGEASCEG